MRRFWVTDVIAMRTEEALKETVTHVQEVQTGEGAGNRLSMRMDGE